jgi:hypothetical protein
LLRLACKKSAHTFSEELLEYEGSKRYQNPWHIRVIYDLLDNVLTQDQESGKIIFNTFGKVNRKIVIECPRNHAKSTSVSVNWSLKELYQDKNLRIVICSNTLAQASAFLREQKAHIERGERLNEAMGSLMPRYPEKWTDTSIIVNRTTKKKDPSISTTGTGGAVLSKRADVVILDDLLNPDNTRTPEAREKVRFWVNNVLRPVLEPKTSRQVVIGTVWYKGDYLDESMQDKTFDVRLQFRAFIKDSLLNIGSNQDHALDIREIFSDEVIEMYGIDASSGVLWPERWPETELLAEKLGSGSVAFNRQYMNIVISEETQIIKTEWLENSKRLGADYTFLPLYDTAKCPYGSLTITQGWDLAISQSARADWTVGVTLGRDRVGQIYLLNIERGKFSPAETRNKIIAQAALYKPTKIKVENVAYQEALRRDLAETTDLPIEGYTTGGEKYDEYVGINSVGVLFENRKIVLPYSQVMTENEKKLIDQFVYECEVFGAESHTGDILMAFWLALNGLRDIQQNSQDVVMISSKGFYDSRRFVSNYSKPWDDDNW